MKNHIACLLATLAIAGSAYYFGTHHSRSISPFTISEARCALRTDMRKLWTDHVWWTRDYLITAIADMPDVTVATNRLLKNQIDIGAAIVPFYGKAAGDQLAALLKDHILISADVVAAAKVNDTTKLKEADARWHANADDISAFLSKANPYWPEQSVKDMMYKHLKLTTDEAMTRIKKDWNADIAAFEEVFAEIMMLADMLTLGIVQQFPEKF